MSQGWVQHRLGSFKLDVHWRVEEGQAAAIVGPSGSGKTTTLRAIAGLLRPERGRVEIGGRVVFDTQAIEWTPPERRRVGYMPQRAGLFPHLTVSENVAFGLSGLHKEEASSRVDELLRLTRVGGLGDRYPSRLSAGEQQRAALARALAPNPDLLLLDEPFAALDPGLRGQLRREIKGLQRETGVTMILVTHDLNDALSLADHVVVLEEGRVAAEGSPMEVLERPATEPLTRLVGVENVYEGKVLSASPGDGLMSCDFGGFMLDVPYAATPLGEQVRIGVRAGDVLVASEAPRGLSAQNTLRGRVSAVARKGFEVGLTVDCGQPMEVEVTPRAVERLGLAEGREVWLVIKSNACLLLE